jgi:hypothetical protein
MVVDVPKVSPVYLGLLARLGFEAYCRLPLVLLTVRLHEAPNLALLARIAQVPDLLVQLASIQHASLDPFQEVRDIGIDLPLPSRSGPSYRRQWSLDGLSDGLSVMASTPSDLADGHTLTM